MARLTPDAPFPPGCAARFKPLKLIASGGFGAVWLAEQVQLERRVAVKLLLDDVLEEKESVERFLGEARITASIEHPHVVRLIDHGVDEGVPWIALEYLPGRSLRDLLETGQVSHELALAAASQVAEALEAAHAQGVLHRDVKPENVIEVEPGRFKVTDFGIAKWRRDGAVKTRTGVILGTPAYLAPELVQGEPVTPRADVYALGVLAYELFAGAPPFTHANPMALLDLQLNAPPPPLRGVSQVVAGAVMRALAKRPEERTPSAARFREELNGAGGSRTGLPRGATRAIETKGRSAAVGAPAATRVVAMPARRRSLVTGLVAGAALGLVAWGLVPRAPVPAVSATPATVAAPAPSEAPATGPLALRYDVVEREREIDVSAITLEPVALELQVAGRSFREKAATRRHRWEVTGLKPSTSYVVTIVDPTGRRQPAHPTRKARTRVLGFLDSSLTSARRIGRSDSTGLIANLELDSGALGVLLTRLRTEPWWMHEEDWGSLLENVGNTRSPLALPLILEISKRVPPEIRRVGVWAALGKLQDRGAYDMLFDDLVRMPAEGGGDFDPEVLGRAMYQSDPDRAEALLERWEQTLPQPSGRQLIALAGLARSVRRPWILAPLQRMLADAKSAPVLAAIGEVAVRGGGPAALELLGAAEARAAALRDSLATAWLVTLAAEIAGAGDARHFLPHLDGSPGEQAAALVGLGTIGARAHVERVRKLLGSTDVAVRDAAIWAAGELRDPLAVPELVRLLSPLGRTAGRAVRALGQIGGAEAERALMAQIGTAQAVRVLAGGVAQPAQIVEVGDTVLELARLRVRGHNGVLEHAASSPVPYIQARAIIATGLVGGRLEALAVRGLSAHTALLPLRDAVCGWLERKRPAGTLVTVEPLRTRRTHVSLALGQRYSLYGCGVFLDAQGQLTVLCGPNARQSGHFPQLLVRVGVDIIDDGGIPLERSTALDPGELVLYPGPDSYVGGSMLVWIGL